MRTNCAQRMVRRPVQLVRRLGPLCLLLLMLTGLNASSNHQSAATATTLAPLAGPDASSGARIIPTVYPTADLVIANAVVTDPPYDADATGTRDATAAIQAALNDRYQAGGGVVWMPAGRYKVTASITIPPHVTLRGDWRDPDVGKGPYGAVVEADVPSGDENAPGLFRISGSAGVNGLTVYYPQQAATNPIPYPYTFEIPGRLLGDDGYMASTVENVTLLDSYRGISAGAQATHEMHTIRNVKGTVLSVGMYLEDSADVSHTENVTFSNTYWANLDPSVSERKPTLAQVDAWTRSHTTALRMGGLDWDQFTNLSFTDDEIGIDVVGYRRGGLTVQLVGVTIENAQIALHIASDYLDGRFGINFANSTFHANQGAHPVALELDDSTGAALLFNQVAIGGGAAAAVDLAGNDLAEFENCTFDAWTGPYAIRASAGTLSVEGSHFLQPLAARSGGVLLQSGVSSATLLDNSFAGDAAALVTNQGAPSVFRQDAGFAFPPSAIPAVYSFPSLPRPASLRLFDVTAAPYDASTDGERDDTAILQRALRDAAAAGGGTVYLPPGIYAVRGHLSVPAGVELRGSDDVPHRAMYLGAAMGTILLAYEGRGTATPDADPAFITLDGNHAGVRGIGIDYPEQSNDSPRHIVAYPWTIRGKGTGVYAYDVAFVNAYQGIDFATYSTDDHYIGGINGFVLKTGIQVGDSREGWVEDTVFNINAWQRATGLPNILTDATLFSVAAAYSRANERAFVITRGAQREHLMNDFVYGAAVGVTVEADANAQVVNVGADGSAGVIEVDDTGRAGVTVLNVQGCGCDLGGIGVRIRAGQVRIFNLLTVDEYAQTVEIAGGTFALVGASLHRGTASISGGTGVLAGALFRDGGPQVRVSGAGTVANLWGNMGAGGFAFTAANGTPLLYSGNVTR